MSTDSNLQLSSGHRLGTLHPSLVRAVQAAYQAAQ